MAEDEWLVLPARAPLSIPTVTYGNACELYCPSCGFILGSDYWVHEQICLWPQAPLGAPVDIEKQQ